MSLRIIKQGILDTIQDCGRYGAQHLGINPGGAIDRFSAQLSNALLGKELTDAVIEFHFPASQVLFEKQAIICLTGADFSPTINGKNIPLDRPIVVDKNSLLAFQKNVTGSRCYLSVLNKISSQKWMNSHSTNIKAGMGGYRGRGLAKYDQLIFLNDFKLSFLLQKKDVAVLPWKAQDIVDTRNEIEFIIGSEWHWLTNEARQTFQEHYFQITNEADRMGYRLAGQKLEVKNDDQLVSSAVSFGTVQLLPNSQLIVLMADHQTTGGYPRVAHVISAHLPVLAQKKPNDVIKFKITSLEEAEKKLVAQKKYLQQLQIACKFRMEELVYSL